jgi:alpha-mannosidase
VSRVIVTVDVQLTAGSAAIGLVVRGDNDAEDCRVRLVVRTGVVAPDVLADAAFGEVARGRAPDDRPQEAGTAREAPLRSAPLHRYVSLSNGHEAATLLSDGLAEYEPSRDGRLAVTLLRAVGELSRHDLPERPGHAGWPVATPGAQAKGRHDARLALLLHAPPSDATRAEVQRAVEGHLLPIVGRTWGTAMGEPSAVPGLRLMGEGLACSACKESEDGRSLVVRCLNLRETATSGEWQLAGVREAWLARLDETPLGALALRDGGVPFEAPPHATVTILLRR